jgi:hypothetical protein
METLIRVIVVLLVVAGLVWLGFQIKPRPFAAFPEESPALKTIPVPAGLPKPVERFYRTVYGDEIPVIETAVFKGRANLAPFGFFMPTRFVFIHRVGHDYRHYFESTWFGLPIMKVNEHYIDGKSYMQLPVGTVDNDPATNQGANLAVWAEAAWFPSVWVTDPRVRWVAVDDVTALLYVPFGDGEENFVVRFDPESGQLVGMEAMRFRDSGPQAKKILWMTRTEPSTGVVPGTRIPDTGSAIWLDKGTPWANFTLEQAWYNVNIDQYIQQKGQ